MIFKAPGMGVAINRAMASRIVTLDPLASIMTSINVPETIVIFHFEQVIGKLQITEIFHIRTHLSCKDLYRLIWHLDGNILATICDSII